MSKPFDWFAEDGGYDQELVGYATEQIETPCAGGSKGVEIKITFRCCNKEVFQFYRAPAITPLPQERLIRVYLLRLLKEVREERKMEHSYLCLHWEELE